MFLSQHDRGLAVVIGCIILFVKLVCGAAAPFGPALDPTDPFNENLPIVLPGSVVTDAYQLIIYDLLEYWKTIANVIVSRPGRHAWLVLSET